MRPTRRSIVSADYAIMYYLYGYVGFEQLIAQIQHIRIYLSNQVREGEGMIIYFQEAEMLTKNLRKGK